METEPDGKGTGVKDKDKNPQQSDKSVMARVQ